ncbi:MAG: efflux RND transporter periplasmic adaptor subunit [Planctomycetes bacterium]|nr:efflux RND transporter periplasmic adaptor subunit [Planctomycetota bacterium]
MKWLGKRIAVLIILVVIVLFSVLLIKRKKHQLAGAPKYGMRPIPVRVITAELGSLSTKIDYLAVVAPVQIANVSARLTAVVDKLLCDEGDWVKAGDMLIELDDREIKNDIASVQADIAGAQSELAANQATVTSLENSVAYWNREAGRDKTLADKGDIPGAQAEATADKANEFKGKSDAARHKSAALKHLMDSLESKKAQFGTRLSYCAIKSPYDGLVTQRLVDPGDLASPGKTLLVVEDRRQLKLTFDVPQQDLSKVQEGLTVRFSANGKTQESELSHMHPSLDKTRMLRAEVFLSGDQVDGLTCGQYLTASVLLNEIKDAVILPASCLVEGPKHFQYVFVVKDGVLIHQKVEVLASTENMTAVEGIEAGRQVVTNTFLGWTTLSAGKKVEVIQ